MHSTHRYLTIVRQIFFKVFKKIIKVLHAIQNTCLFFKAFILRIIEYYRSFIHLIDAQYMPGLELGPRGYVCVCVYVCLNAFLLFIFK